MRSLLPAVAEQLFQDIEKIYLESSQIPDDLLIALRFVFGPCALQALDLVDRRSVTRLSSPSGRSVFQVTGGSGRSYTCLVSCHYCPCPAFSYSVLRRNDALLVSPSSSKKCPITNPCHVGIFERRGEALSPKATLGECKHILAVYLCRAMGVTRQESVCDQQMTAILSGAEAS